VLKNLKEAAINQLQMLMVSLKDQLNLTVLVNLCGKMI